MTRIIVLTQDAHKDHQATKHEPEYCLSAKACVRTSRIASAISRVHADGMSDHSCVGVASRWDTQYSSIGSNYTPT